MNSGLWSAVGILCGAALGVILPVGTVYLITLTSDNAAGIGTPFALLTIVTLPLGMLFGAYAGRYRARTGQWKGMFKASTHEQASSEFQSVRLSQNFSAFDRQLTSFSEKEARSTKENYLRQLLDEYESTKFNYRLAGVWLIASLVVPFLVVFPIKIGWEHYRLKTTLREHIQKVMDAWQIGKKDSGTSLD